MSKRTPSSSDRAVYIISVVADIAGIHPQTLRMYERKGLLEPQRTPGNSRRYSQRDIDQLNRIQQLTQMGVNLAGVRTILALERKLEDLQMRLEKIERRRVLAEAELEHQRSTRRRGMLVRLVDVSNIFERTKSK